MAAVKRLHTKSIAVDLEYYENAHYQNTLHRAQRDASERPPLIIDDLVQMAQNGISLVTVAGLVISLNWIMVLLLAATAVPGLLVRLRF